MRKMLVVAASLTGTAVPTMAQERCWAPPPVFDCDDWRKSSSGRLVAKRNLTVGLLGMSEGSYIGKGTVIDGLDYSESLREQCGDRL